jgi:predicted nucleotidyltransferase
MVSKKYAVQCLREHLEELRNEYHVSRIGVFGSFARGEVKETSDIDILVEFDKAVGLFHFIDLQDRLGQILERKVDLATPDALHPVIKDEILNEVFYV